MLKRIASNATANIANGMTATAFQIGMTAVIARSSNPRDLSIWSLAASMAGFAPLLACNVSSIVARRLTGSNRAVADAAGHVVLVMAAARALARRLSLYGLAIALALAVAAPFLYPKVMPHPSWPASLMIGCFFAGSCWVVSAQADLGWLITEHRNWPIAHSGAVARATAIVISILILFIAGWPSWIAIVLSSAALWSGAWYMRRQTIAPIVPESRENLVHEERQINGIARSFAVWNITSAAIQASTVPLVGLIAPSLTTAFFLAFTLATILFGVATAASNALIAPLAHSIGAGRLPSAARMAVRATLLLWSCVAMSYLVIYFLMGPIVTIWVGSHHQTIDPVVLKECFGLFALQQSLRSITIISSIILSLGAPNRVMLYSPLTEMVIAFLLAAPLAIWVSPFAYLLGLAAAGGMGGLAVLWLTVKYVFKSSGADRHGRQLATLVVGLQVVTVLIFGTLMANTEVFM